MGIQFNGNTDTITTNDGTLIVNPQTTFGGEVGIAGTLTYEDVTNIDSVGVITARSGIRVGVNGIKRETVHLDAGDSGANYLRFTNTTTGNGTADGFNVGINADENALLWNFENKDTIFATDNEERLRIKSDGKTGIGTDNPQTIFHILDNVPTIRFTDKNSTGTPDCEVGGAGGNVDISADINGEKSDSVIRFNVDGEQKVAVDSNGALLLSTAGTRRNTKGSSQYQAFLVEGTTNNTTRMSMIRSSNDDNGPEIQIIKTRGTSVGSVTKPNQNDYLGAFVFLAGDDSDLFTRGAEIGVQATGTPANDRCPTDIIFSTTPTSGASTPQERLRINSSGHVTKPNQPMFAAQGSGDAISAQSALPFDSINYNIGSHWNNSTFKFTCPVTGYYYVTCHVIPQAFTSNNGNCELYIRMDAAGARLFLDRKAKLSNYASNNFSVGGSRIVYATANQTISVELNSIEGSPTLEPSSHLGIMLMA